MRRSHARPTCSSKATPFFDSFFCFATPNSDGRVMFSRTVQGWNQVEKLEDETDVIAPEEGSLLVGHGGNRCAVDKRCPRRSGISIPLIRRLSRVLLPLPLTQQNGDSPLTKS